MFLQIYKVPVRTLAWYGLLNLDQRLYLVLYLNWICFALSVGWILVYELKLGERFGSSSIPLLLINIARCTWFQLPELFHGNIYELKICFSLICDYCFNCEILLIYFFFCKPSSAACS